MFYPGFSPDQLCSVPRYRYPGLAFEVSSTIYTHLVLVVIASQGRFFNYL